MDGTLFFEKVFFLLFHKWPRFTLEKVPLGNVIKVSYSYISVISIEVIFHFSLIITSWAKLRSLRIPFIFVVFVLFFMILLKSFWFWPYFFTKWIAYLSNMIWWFFTDFFQIFTDFHPIFRFLHRMDCLLLTNYMIISFSRYLSGFRIFIKSLNIFYFSVYFAHEVGF